MGRHGGRKERGMAVVFRIYMRKPLANEMQRLHAERRRRQTMTSEMTVTKCTSKLLYVALEHFLAI